MTTFCADLLRLWPPALSLAELVVPALEGAGLVGMAVSAGFSQG